jgi:colanic acid/amylovoran biosynthesis protein
MYPAVSPVNGRLKKLLAALTMMVCTAIWAGVFRISRLALPLPRPWREPARILAESDMQICVGGGYLRAREDLISTIMLVLMFHQVWLAKALGKPVYLYAQSFGPYPGLVQRKVASIGLGYADRILVRETRSKELLAGLGLTGDRVVQVPDSAFLFQPRLGFDARPLLGTGEPDEKVVGVTVRTWLQGTRQQAYEQAMAEFIDHLSRRGGLRIAVIAQVTAVHQNDDDRVVGRRIQQLLGPRSNVVFLEQRFTHHEIKSVFANLDYLVGTRFHSVIFALTAGVPAVAIEYEHKTSGVMRDLGLETWVLPIEDVTAGRLIELFDALVLRRETYVRQLRQIVPGYVTQAAEAAAIIKRTYHRSQRIPVDAGMGTAGALGTASEPTASTYEPTASVR